MRKSSALARQLRRVSPFAALLILLLTMASGEESISLSDGEIFDDSKVIIAAVEEVINLSGGEKYGYTKIYDITNKITVGMPIWGSFIGLALQKLRFIDNITGEVSYKFSTHLGTHADAPNHVYSNMSDVNSLSLETLNGMALVMNAPRNKNLTAEVLASMNIPKDATRVLFKTENSFRRLMHQKAFSSDYAGLTTDGAEWLVKNTNIKLLGMDYLSVAIEKDALRVHQILLHKGDLIPVEALDLDAVTEGHYMLHCLPLRIPDADGSATRCILTE